VVGGEVSVGGAGAVLAEGFAVGVVNPRAIGPLAEEALSYERLLKGRCPDGEELRIHFSASKIKDFTKHHPV